MLSPEVITENEDKDSYSKKETIIKIKPHDDCQ